MNWSRGLLRLWMVASLLWIGFWTYWRDVPCALGFNYFGAKWWCGDHFVAPPAGYILDITGETFLIMLGVPLLVLVLGILARWIAEGFRTRPGSN
jgi:hypothetical protein